MKLDTFLRANSLTLQAFGARIGVSHATVSRWASGKAAPRGRAMLQRIAEATDGAVTAADFFDEASAASKNPVPGLAEAQSPCESESKAARPQPSAIAEKARHEAEGWDRARRWAEENREAIEAHNRYFEENDTPLAKYRMF